MVYVYDSESLRCLSFGCNICDLVLQDIELELVLNGKRGEENKVFS